MVWKWVRRLLPSPTPREEDEQVPVWSIRRSDKTTFYRIVYVLWFVGLWHIGHKATERADAPFTDWGSAAELGVVAVREFGEVGFGAAVLAMALTRPVNMMGGIAMTLYQAMVNRWVIPVIERHKSEGRAEGRVDGERAMLERLLLLRFGSLSPEVEARVAGASVVDLETWADKVLDANTLDDVFNSIHKG